MKTAAAYIRVSTDEQTEYSPGSQLRAIRKYAQEHELMLPEEFVFTDEGLSGRNVRKRPSFGKMIAAAKQKPPPFQVILLWKFSRFARNRQDSIIYKSMLRKQCGIDVISVSEQLSGDNTSILIEALIEAMDEYYSLNLAEEVRRGMNEKFSRGEAVSQPPFGYRTKNGVFVPDKDNACAVQMIFGDYLAGMSIRRIAEKLNCMGIRTAKGNRFESRAVEYILTNPTYTGKLRRSRNGRDSSDRFYRLEGNIMLADGQHIPIISQEEFEAVRTRLAAEKMLYPPYSRRSPADFMLRGLVRCSCCGASLTMTSSHRSLQCHRYAKGSCRVSHSITVKKLNEAVTGKIRSDLGKMQFCITTEGIPARGGLPGAAAMLGREKKKLARIREAYESGIDTAEEYRENKQRIQSQIAELSAIVQSSKADRATKSSYPRSLCKGIDMIDRDDVSEALKNTVLRSFIERIIFFREEDCIEIIYKL